MPPHHPHDDEGEGEGPPRPRHPGGPPPPPHRGDPPPPPHHGGPPPPPHHGGPPPPPHHGGLPPPKPHWAAIDRLPDEDVLRYAPPEIRRLWRRMVSLEEQVGDVREALRRIEELLRARGGAP